MNSVFWVALGVFVIASVVVPSYITYDVIKRGTTLSVILTTVTIALVWVILAPFLVLYHYNIITL